MPDELWPFAQEQWLRILSGRPPEDIRRGLDTWQEDWPPNIFEFEKACRPLVQKRELYKALPNRSRSTYPVEKAKKNLEGLKDMIKQAKIGDPDYVWKE